MAYGNFPLLTFFPKGPWMAPWGYLSFLLNYQAFKGVGTIWVNLRSIIGWEAIILTKGPQQHKGKGPRRFRLTTLGTIIPLNLNLKPLVRPEPFPFIQTFLIRGLITFQNIRNWF